MTSRPFERASRGWSAHERMTLRRAEASLRATGQAVDTGWGVSDEGDPWHVLYDSLTGDVVAHIARLDAVYVAFAPPLRAPLRHGSLDALMAELLLHLPHPATSCNSHMVS